MNFVGDWSRAIDLHCRLEVEVGMRKRIKVGLRVASGREMTSDIEVGMKHRLEEE